MYMITSIMSNIQCTPVSRLPHEEFGYIGYCKNGIYKHGIRNLSIVFILQKKMKMLPEIENRTLFSGYFNNDIDKTVETKCNV